MLLIFDKLTIFYLTERLLARCLRFKFSDAFQPFIPAAESMLKCLSLVLSLSLPLSIFEPLEAKRTTKL
jgi:hypothetical protein